MSLVSVPKSEESEASQEEPKLKKLHCPICLKVYKSPRILPCLHAYCEECLQTYIQSAEKKKGLRDGFDCPVCRELTRCPDEEQVTSKWAKCFPPFNYRKISESVLGKKVRRICDPCSVETKATKPAFKSCAQCQEFLCRECVVYHRKFKMTKNHRLISVKKEQQYTEEQLKTDWGEEQLCHLHEKEAIKYFCKDDNSLCCSTCAFEEHRKCKNVVDVAALARGLKVDIRGERLDERLKSLQSHLEQLTDIVQVNGTEMKKQIQDFPKTIKSVKARVLDLFDKMESDINSESRRLLASETTRHSNQIQRYKSLTAALATSYSLLASVLKCGSESQLFITICKLEDQLIEYDKMVREEHSKVQPAAALQFEIQDTLEQTMRLLESLGQVMIDGCITNLPRFPNVKPIKDCKIYRCIVEEVDPPDGRTPKYSGATALPDGRVILVDSDCNKLCLVDKSWKITSELQLDSSPWKVDLLDEHTAVANLRFQKKIAVVSVGGNLVVTRMIDTILPCQCLAVVDKDNLAIVWNNSYKFTFGVMTLEGREKVYLEKDTNGREFKGFWHFSLDASKSRVLQACNRENVLFCFETTGRPSFTYKHSELAQPGGVDVDVDGNIYVCGCSSNNIHQLSPYGNLLQIISSDSLRLPLNICFLPGRVEFFVTRDNDRNKIHRFNLMP